MPGHSMTLGALGAPGSAFANRRTVFGMYSSDPDVSRSVTVLTIFSQLEGPCPPCTETSNVLADSLTVSVSVTPPAIDSPVYVLSSSK